MVINAIISAALLIGVIMLCGVATRVQESNDLPDGIKLFLTLLLIFGVPILLAFIFG